MKKVTKRQQRPKGQDIIYTQRMLAKGAGKSTLFKQVQKQILEMGKDNFNVERDIDWSILGHQIVGCERY